MTRRLLARSCCSTPSAMGFWAGAFVLLYGAAPLLASVWPALGPYGDTLILAALATACFINFSRNRTLHYGITGPIFLMGTVAAALVESGRWVADLSIVWGVVLLGVGIAFVVEWWTIVRNGSSSAQDVGEPPR
jgi:hypothetical protein